MFGVAPPTRSGNRHPLSTPFGAFAARDGHLVICVLNNGQFARLMECIGQKQLATDPRFVSDQSRTDHEPVLRAAIETWLGCHDVAEAVAILGAAGIPASSIQEPADVFAGDQVASRGLLPKVAHPLLGAIPVMEQPVQFAGLTRGRMHPAPALGQDSAAVLARWLGQDAQQTAKGDL
jgi:CoA:oxalate CoA-transferase